MLSSSSGVMYQEMDFRDIIYSISQKCQFIQSIVVLHFDFSIFNKGLEGLLLPMGYYTFFDTIISFYLKIFDICREICIFLSGFAVYTYRMILYYSYYGLILYFRFFTYECIISLI